MVGITLEPSYEWIDGQDELIGQCFYMHRAYVLVQRRVWVIILATPLM